MPPRFRPLCSEGGPNICGVDSTFRPGGRVDCIQDVTVCGTARSSKDYNLSFTYFCPGDLPDGGTLNAAGQTCYDTLSDCVAGPNACAANGVSCVFAPFECSTGLASGTPNAYICPLDAPSGSSYSYSTGLLCYEVRCLHRNPREGHLCCALRILGGESVYARRLILGRMPPAGSGELLAGPEWCVSGPKRRRSPHELVRKQRA